MEVYKDKIKIFSCDVKVEGAKLSETNARLVLEFNNGPSILYMGKIDSAGKCEIRIPPIKGITESTEGIAKLEVIAESTYFEPWTSNFNVKQSKQVTVEVKEPQQLKDPGIKVVTEVAELKGDNPRIVKIKEALKLLPKNKLKVIVERSEKFNPNKRQKAKLDELLEGKSDSYKRMIGSIYFKK